jgi:ATP-dependent DNA helicase RecG
MAAKNSTELSIYSNISEIKGFGPKKAGSFSAAGIDTLEDMLYYYPRSYEDYRTIKDSCDCKDGDTVLLKGKVLMVSKGKGYGSKRTLHVLSEDHTGRFEILFFGAAYLSKAFTVGAEYTFFGKVKVQNGRVTMFHPDFSKFDGSEKGIIPVYPLRKDLKQKDLRKLSELACEHADEIEESLPLKVVSDMNLCSNAYALRNIHYPQDENGYKESRYRLVFEELFDLKVALSLSRSRGEVKGKGLVINSGKAESFVSSLPYELTGAQKRALSEVLSDMRS